MSVEILVGVLYDGRICKILGLIGYYRFARLLNVGGRLLLFIPIHNVAYVGLLGNVARREQHVDEGLDLSVWNVIAWSLVACCVIFFRDTIFLLAVGLVFYMIQFHIHFFLFRLYSRHPVLVAMLWFIPGVILWQAIVAERRISTICKEYTDE